MPPSLRRRWCSRRPGSLEGVAARVGRDRSRERPRRGCDRGRVVVGPRPARSKDTIAHDAKAQRRARGGRCSPPTSSTPAARPTSSTTSRPSTGSSSSPTRRPTRTLPRSSAMRRHASSRRAPRLTPEGARPRAALPRDRAPLTQVLADMEDTGVKIDEYRMGEITPGSQTGSRSLEQKAYELRGRGVHPRLDPAGRADPLREARADAGPQGQDRLLDGYPRPPQDPASTRSSA